MTAVVEPPRLLMLTFAELRGKVPWPDLSPVSGNELLDSYTLCVRLSYRQSSAWLLEELRRRLQQDSPQVGPLEPAQEKEP